MTGPAPIRPGLILLASYPKSGNTWVRLFLASLEQDRDIDLSVMDETSSGATSRGLLQMLLGIDLAELSADEVEELRPLAYCELARRGGGRPVLLKVHDGYRATPSGAALFPPRAVAGCVHLVRDPRDICLSLAAHCAVDADRAIAYLASPDYGSSRRLDVGRAQVREIRGSWSGHGGSWLAAPLPRLTLRYEDMVADPLTSLGRIAAFCGLEASPEAVARAVERSSFARLAARESISGFRERPAGMERFFRSGRVQQWRQDLTRAQVARIERDHGALMARLGYELSGGRYDPGRRSN